MQPRKLTGPVIGAALMGWAVKIIGAFVIGLGLAGGKVRYPACGGNVCCGALVTGDPVTGIELEMEENKSTIMQFKQRHLKEMRMTIQDS